MGSKFSSFNVNPNQIISESSSLSSLPGAKISKQFSMYKKKTEEKSLKADDITIQRRY